MLSPTNNSIPLEIRFPSTADEIGMIRELFQEYERSLGFDLCFQNFSRELAQLPGAYAPPSGWLLLATSSQSAAGCAGIRRIDDGVCELKRMYVRPTFRGLKLGRQLAELLIEKAREIGYQKMRLDTIGTMVEAIGLYRSLGFHEIEPYYNNPVARVIFMEKNLQEERIVNSKL